MSALPGAVEAPGEPVGTPAVPRTDARASSIDQRATLPPSAGRLGPRAAELPPVDHPHAPDHLSPALYDFLAPPQAADEIGRLGPFRVLKVLGAGGMGVVYQAEDPQLNRLVALKAMLPGLAAGGSNKERFLREARAAAAIEHDHIVAIYLVDEDRGVPFIAMPLLRGESLEDRLQRERKLPLSEALRIGRETASGLAAAHARGLIHRDIKPANLWLEGDKKRVKVLDFGLARQRGDTANLTQQGAIVGTPAYMAPEQANGRKVDSRCDLFSLGCVLYRMNTGQLPFPGADMVATLIAVTSTQPRSPRQINPQVPPSLSRLIMQLLAKAPGDRPASAHEVVQAVEEIESEPAPTAAPTGPAIDEQTLPEIHRPRPRRRSKRSPPPWAWLAGASGLAAAALVAVLAVVLLMKRPAPDTKRAVEAAGPRASADFNRGTAGDPRRNGRPGRSLRPQRRPSRFLPRMAAPTDPTRPIMTSPRGRSASAAPSAWSPMTAAKCTIPTRCAPSRKPHSTSRSCSCRRTSVSRMRDSGAS